KKNELSKEELIAIIVSDYDSYNSVIDTNIVNSFRKNISDIKKFIEEFNCELKRINPNIDELICYSVDKELKKKSENNPKNNRLKLEYHSFFVNHKYLDI
ncbi:MAG: hypothetical protein ACRCZ9_04605, partial [Fusobacteriaceae bacterium]